MKIFGKVVIGFIILVEVCVGAVVGYYGPYTAFTEQHYRVQGETTMVSRDAAIMALEREDGISILNSSSDTVLVVYDFDTTSTKLADKWSLDYTKVKISFWYYFVGLLSLFLAVLIVTILGAIGLYDGLRQRTADSC